MYYSVIYLLGSSGAQKGPLSNAAISRVFSGTYQ